MYLLMYLCLVPECRTYMYVSQLVKYQTNHLYQISCYRWNMFSIIMFIFHNLNCNHSNLFTTATRSKPCSYLGTLRQGLIYVVQNGAVETSYLYAKISTKHAITRLWWRGVGCFFSEYIYWFRWRPSHCISVWKISFIWTALKSMV